MKRILVSWAVALVLSGCMLGPDFQRPQLPEPAQYKEPVVAGESIANLPWWEVYSDLSLQKLIRTALEENKDLSLAFERINEARAALGFVRADQYPFLDYSGGVSRREFPDDAQSNMSRRAWLASADLFFEVDLWGKLRRSTESARAQLLATEEAYRSLTITLVANVAELYYLLGDLDEQLVISERTLESRKGSTKIINERLKGGYVPELDLNQAQIEEADAAVVVHQVQRQIGIAENALSILLGRAPGQIDRGVKLSPSSLPPSIPAGLPSELVQRRPDVLQAEAELAAQTAQIGVAEALRFPSIGLTASYGMESPELSEFDPGESRFWSLSADVAGPLLSYDKNIRRVDIEEARTAQLALAYEQRLLLAFGEVEDALISIRTFRDEYNVVSKQVQAAKNATRLSRARYDAGQTNYLEVLDSERSLFRSELAETQTLRLYLVSVVTLYKALGGGWNPDDPALSPQGVAPQP